MSEQNKTGKKTKRNNRKYIFGLILTFAQIVLSVVALYLLWQSNLIPARYLFLLLFVFAVLIIVFRLLMGRGVHRIRFWVGAVLSIICCVVLLVVSIFVPRVTGTLENITDTQVETTNVGVYVLAEDPAESIRDVAQDPFGILSTLVREDTDHVIDLIEESTGDAVYSLEYDDVADLADSLLDGDCRSIILSEGFVDVITEIEGYEEFDSRIRLLDNYEWDNVVAVGLEEGETQTQTQALAEVEDTELIAGVEETEAILADVTPPTAEEVREKGSFLLYISGIDTAGAVSSKGRSDVNVLAAVNMDKKEILLVSTPRDYFVPLSVSNGQKDKLTNAGLYGIQASIDTLEMIYGLNIDYYFRINFSGFQSVIDALGGVDVYSSNSFDANSYHFSQGVNHLNGAAALAFVRERHSFSEGDRQRGENQMAVITSVLNALQSSALLNDVPALMTSLQSSFDSNMPYDLLTDIVKDQLRDNTSWSISSYSVNGSDEHDTGYTTKQYTYVMAPDYSTVATARAMIQGVLD